MNRKLNSCTAPTSFQGAHRSHELNPIVWSRLSGRKNLWCDSSFEEIYRYLNLKPRQIIVMDLGSFKNDKIIVCFTKDIREMIVTFHAILELFSISDFQRE